MPAANKLWIAALLLAMSFLNPSAELNRKESRKAFELLNAIRKNSSRYAAELKLPANLPIVHQPLRWSDTLARVAEARVMDMARRNYFGHTDPDGYGVNYHLQQAGYNLNKDWLNTKSNNYFESLALNVTNGEDGIKTLILDENDPSFGHRNHLLGVGEWNSSLYDVGIGYASADSASLHYSWFCVIIAKHDWNP